MRVCHHITCNFNCNCLLHDHSCRKLVHILYIYYSILHRNLLNTMIRIWSAHCVLLNAGKVQYHDGGGGLLHVMLSLFRISWSFATISARSIQQYAPHNSLIYVCAFVICNGCSREIVPFCINHHRSTYTYRIVFTFILSGLYSKCG